MLILLFEDPGHLRFGLVFLPPCLRSFHHFEPFSGDRLLKTIDPVDNGILRCTFQNYHLASIRGSLNKLFSTDYAGIDII